MTCNWCNREHTGGPEYCITGILLVCGGRSFTDQDRAFRILDVAARRIEVLGVRHGGASGADLLAGEWAASRGVPADVMSADWGQHGKAAGPMRNAAMLAPGDVAACVALPGGAGTADMVRRCRRAGVRVWKVSP